MRDLVKSKGRIDYIDIAKALGIIAIVDVHIESGPVLTLGSTYHVLIFFFVSGLLESYRNYEPLSVYVKKKAKNLLYPYATLSALNIVLQIFIALLRKKAFVATVIPFIIKSVSLEGIGTLWFLPVMFIASILFRLFSSIYKGLPSVIGMFLAIFCIQLIMPRGGVIETLQDSIMYPFVSIALQSIVASGFIMLGYYYSHVLDYIAKKSIHIVSVHLIIFLLLLIIDFALYRSGDYKFDLHKLYISDALIYFATGCCGVLSMTSLSVVLSNIPIAKSFLTWFGRNSLIVMATHKELYISYIFSILCTRLVTVSGIFAILPLVSVIIVEVAIIQVVNKSHLKYLFVYPVRTSKRSGRCNCE